MKAVRDDLISLFDFAWQRFRSRMAGLDDAEWAWAPIPDDRVSLRWRLGHLTDLLTEERNHRWLGLDVPAHGVPGPAGGAAEAMAGAEAGYSHWRGLLDRTDDAWLAAPIGPVAGHYGGSTRHSFVLHVADEVIHHSAEAALLRDLYPGARR